MKGIDMNILRNVKADDPGSSKRGRPPKKLGSCLFCSTGYKRTTGKKKTLDRRRLGYCSTRFLHHNSQRRIQDLLPRDLFDV